MLKPVMEKYAMPVVESRTSIEEINEIINQGTDADIKSILESNGVPLLYDSLNRKDTARQEEILTLAEKHGGKELADQMVKGALDSNGFFYSSHARGSRLIRDAIAKNDIEQQDYLLALAEKHGGKELANSVLGGALTYGAEQKFKGNHSAGFEEGYKLVKDAMEIMAKYRTPELYNRFLELTERYDVTETIQNAFKGDHARIFKERLTEHFMYFNNDSKELQEHLFSFVEQHGGKGLVASMVMAALSKDNFERTELILGGSDSELKENIFEIAGKYGDDAFIQQMESKFDIDLTSYRQTSTPAVSDENAPKEIVQKLDEQEACIIPFNESVQELKKSANATN